MKSTNDFGYIQNPPVEKLKRNSSSINDTLVQSKYPHTQFRQSPDKLMNKSSFGDYNKSKLGAAFGRFEITILAMWLTGRRRQSVPEEVPDSVRNDQQQVEAVLAGFEIGKPFVCQQQLDHIFGIW